jgi:hypothetical protein
MGSAAAQQPSIDVCTSCGKLFPRVYVRLCSECVRDDDKRFELVRDFLRENQGSSIAEIAEATGLSRGDVSRFYGEGRLVEIDPGPGGGTSCTCAIERKRCGFCRRQLARQLDDMRQDISSQPSGPRNGWEPPDRPRSSGGSAPSSGGSASRSSGESMSRSRPAAEEDDGRVHYIRRARRTDR